MNEVAYKDGLAIGILMGGLIAMAVVLIMA